MVGGLNNRVRVLFLYYRLQIRQTRREDNYMATQEDKIREMANKKLLNGEQKKVLYKLFEQKINDRISKTKADFYRVKDITERKILAEAKQSPAIKKLIAAIKQAEIDQKTAENALDNAGYKQGYHNELTISYSGHPELKKLEKLSDKTLAKMEELKLKLLSDIHGLPMTYAEMTAYINSELAKIENE